MIECIKNKKEDTELNSFLEKADSFIDDHIYVGEIPVYFSSGEIAMLYSLLKVILIEVKASGSGNYPTLNELGHLLDRIEQCCYDGIRLDEIV
jgi:hypothetical protein